jgi:hypothetical protein
VHAEFLDDDNGAMVNVAPLRFMPTLSRGVFAVGICAWHRTGTEPVDELRFPF